MTKFLGRGLSDDIENLGTWPNVLCGVFGLGLLGTAIVAGGPLRERVASGAVGSLIGLMSIYNLYRISQGELEHPDVLRISALLSLGLIAVVLSSDSPPFGVLTDISLILGSFTLLVNLVDFLRQFKYLPSKRKWARNHGPTVVDFGRNIRGRLRQQIQSNVNTIKKLLS
ncbi:MAG: hypothetical protein ABEI86_03545, partial [Halobacteriaceae archaeon]